MKKQLLFVSVFLLTSCSFKMDYGENVENKYETYIPYIEIEKTEENIIYDINIDEYAVKMDNKNTFICYFYTSNCSACKGTKEKYIIPYIEETKNKIYALDVYNDKNSTKLEILKSYQPEDSTYVHLNENNQMVVSRPLIQIVYEGQVVAYEKGLSKNIRYILDGYCL